MQIRSRGRSQYLDLEEEWGKKGRKEEGRDGGRERGRGGKELGGGRDLKELAHMIIRGLAIQSPAVNKPTAWTCIVHSESEAWGPELLMA